MAYSFGFSLCTSFCLLFQADRQVFHLFCVCVLRTSYTSTIFTSFPLHSLLPPTSSKSISLISFKFITYFSSLTHTLSLPPPLSLTHTRTHARTHTRAHTHRGSRMHINTKSHTYRQACMHTHQARHGHCFPQLWHGMPVTT